VASERRRFLKVCVVSIASSPLSPAVCANSSFLTALRIAFLHLASIPGDLDYNRRQIERGLRKAAKSGAHWVITPELCVSGYGFAQKIGTHWISEQPDSWTKRLCGLAAELGVTVFLGQPERDGATGKLHNAVLVIDRDGTILGRHRKINPLKTGAEAWSHPGETVEAISIPSFGKIGILICSDAFAIGIGQQLHRSGAQLLVSSAAWAPGLHGPSGEWEECSRITRLPLFVCNRTGLDVLDFTDSDGVVLHDGARLVAFQSPRSALFTVDWDQRRKRLARPGYRMTAI
jgi:predicted amidohydrolase